jgi:hypothetical protein
VEYFFYDFGHLFCFYYQCPGEWRTLAVVSSELSPTAWAGLFSPDSPALYRFEVTQSTSLPGAWDEWTYSTHRKLRFVDRTASRQLVVGNAGSSSCFWSTPNTVPFYDRAIGCGYQEFEIDLCDPRYDLSPGGECWVPCTSGYCYSEHIPFDEWL